jgi:hypothetical protein
MKFCPVKQSLTIFDLNFTAVESRRSLKLFYSEAAFLTTAFGVRLDF